MNKKIKDLIKALLSIQGRGLFSFAAETIEEGLKNKRQTDAQKAAKAPKEPTPSRFAFVTKQHFATVSLGNDYEQAVNNRLVKLGLKPDFESGDTYCHPVKREDGTVSRILMKHNTKEQHYLRVYPDLCHSFVVETRIFDAEGTELTKEEWKAIREDYFDKSDDGVVAVRNYKIEGLLWLKRGEVIIKGGEAVAKKKKA